MESQTSEKFVETLVHGNETFKYFSLAKLGEEKILRLPISVRVLLEAALRKYDNFVIKEEHIGAILNWGTHDHDVEIPFYPARVLLQDYTGVPCVVDLASMRTAINAIDPKLTSLINPLVPVELVVDHSVQVDYYGTPEARVLNEDKEFERNKERFRLLKWGQSALTNLKIVPPGSGIVHQVNLEALARVVFETQDKVLYPDSVIGTDSHTTMINGLGVVGWGVGGIEAEAVMLGESVTMLLPQVVGVELKNSLPLGVCATDAVLTLTNMLRKVGVVGRFVEFFGEGVTSLSVQDRATLSNMSPEYGATIGFFPVDQKSIEYLRETGRDQRHLEIVEQYLQRNHMFRNAQQESKIQFTKVVTLDLAQIVPTAAGPKRPQDLKPLKTLKADFIQALTNPVGFNGFGVKPEVLAKEILTPDFKLRQGSILIAAITSCTNTSNPFVLVSAALLARKATQLGLKVPSFVKTSLSPGSKVVAAFFENSGLQNDLNSLGFYLAGFGCMTCIGNSGDLNENITKLVEANKDMVFASVLSGNRNFEGRVHPLTKANYLCAPVYVVAYALAGRIDIDFEHEPIAISPVTNAPVFLRDIFPPDQEVTGIIKQYVTPELYISNYGENYLKGNPNWQSLNINAESGLFDFEAQSTYIRNPPYFDNFKSVPTPPTSYKNLKVLLYLGDSITTDHISPAGNISKVSSTAKYFAERTIGPKDFNSYGARRGNHEVMVRGTFANITIKNKLIKDVDGPYTVTEKGGSPMFVFEAAEKENFDNLIIIAGKEYGSGSSRDWAAKGPKLLGVKVVIAESFEKIHRSNLIGMGILPLQFKGDQTAESLGLTGYERFSVDLSDLHVKGDLNVVTDNGLSFTTLIRIDTDVELEYFKHDGILLYVFRKLLRNNQ
jgi:aconitate hydratase